MGLTAIVIGATGATGKELVKKLIEDERFDIVKIFTRRKSDFFSQKLQEFVVDFDDIESFAKELKGDMLYSVMGTTIKQAKTKENQYRVDFTYQLEVAKMAAKNRVSRLILQSSVGANARSNNFYLKTKGALEEAVRDLEFQHISIFRPSILDAKRKPMRIAESIGIFLAKGLKYIPFLKQYQPLKVADLAQVLINASMEATSQKIAFYEPTEIFDAIP